MKILNEFLDENSNPGENDHLLYSVNSTNETIENVKVCMVTGHDISMQQKGSKFLNVVGLRLLKEKNPRSFYKLEKRLSKKWENASATKRLEEISHSVRNEYYNRIHNTRRAIYRLMQYPALFDNWTLISEEKLRIARIFQSPRFKRYMR